MKRATFIKILLIEIAWLTVVALVSAGLYHLSAGIDLSCDNYYEMITFEMRRNAMFFGLFTHFFLPLFFVTCAVRLFYNRFAKIQTLLSLVVTALLWIAALIATYIALGSENVVFSENGWTIYPAPEQHPGGSRYHIRSGCPVATPHLGWNYRAPCYHDRLDGAYPKNLEKAVRKKSTDL